VTTPLLAALTAKPRGQQTRGLSVPAPAGFQAKDGGRGTKYTLPHERGIVQRQTRLKQQRGKWFISPAANGAGAAGGVSSDLRERGKK